MATFNDDFNRADGALGGNWVTTLGTPSISGGKVIGISVASAVNTTIGDADRISAETWLYYNSGSSYTSGPIVKCPASGQGGFRARVITSAGIQYLVIDRFVTPSWNQLTYVSLGAAIPNYFPLYLEWDRGHLLARWNNDVTLEWDDSMYAVNAYAGLHTYTAAWAVDNIVITAGAAAEFSVSPEAIGNYGQCSELSLTGTNTSWTPGVPGSPIFTVDHGTITSQEVLTATTATITYCPGDFLGTATFTDPSTGNTDTVLVTSDPNIVPPGEECCFDPDFIAVADATGNAHPTSELLTTLTPLPPDNTGDTGIPLFDFLLAWEKAQHGPGGPLPSETGILNDLVRVLYFSQEVTPGENVFSFAKIAAGDALAAHTSLDDMRGPTEITLQDILDALGSGGTTDLSPVRDDLGVWTQSTFPSILVLLLAMWGDGRPTLAAIYSAVLAAQSLTISTRGELRDFFAALTSSGALSLQSILDVLSAYNSAYIGWFGTLSSQIEDVDNFVRLLWSSDEELRGPSHLTLEDILTRLDYQVDHLVDVIEALPHRPYWPGIEHVTLGAVRDLAAGLTLAGPMDGVLINITGTDPGTGFFDYDTVRHWRNVGALSFYTDNGYQEGYQAIGWQKGIYMPQGMRRAQGVRFHLGRGPRGTVQPWTINSGG